MFKHGSGAKLRLKEGGGDELRFHFKKIVLYLVIKKIFEIFGNFKRGFMTRNWEFPHRF